MTTNDVVRTLTLEQLQEWLEQQATKIEQNEASCTLMSDIWKMTGMHRAFTQVAEIIKAGELPK